MEDNIKVYALSIKYTDDIADDIPDEVFINNGKEYTLEDFIYNLNRDLINIELYWFRIIKTIYYDTTIRKQRNA